MRLAPILGFHPVQISERIQILMGTAPLMEKNQHISTASAGWILVTRRSMSIAGIWREFRNMFVG